ncbi:MAG: hypothetical protein FJ299_01535 [Planctomycetes bacterium]|nr:hypothetical protein [Planctomycetota bacterium]
MTIVRVRGRDLREALERARSQGGDDALVVAQESLPDGSVSISVSVPTDPNVLVPAPRRADVRRKVWPSAEPPENGLRDLTARLVRNGASEAFAARIGKLAAREGASGILAIDAAARALATCVAIAPSPQRGARIAFVGPSGAGKSSAAGRLALRMGRAGRRVGFVGLGADAERVGLPFAAAARALGRPVAIAGDSAALERALRECSDCDIVLLDSPGDASLHSDIGGAQSLLVASAQLSVVSYLVLSAALSRRVLIEQCEAHAPLSPRAAVLTRFDEASEPGTAVEICADRSIGLALLSKGPLQEQHLCRADAERVADLMLRGRFE